MTFHSMDPNGASDGVYAHRHSRLSLFRWFYSISSPLCQGAVCFHCKPFFNFWICRTQRSTGRFKLPKFELIWLAVEEFLSFSFFAFQCLINEPKEIHLLSWTQSSLLYFSLWAFLLVIFSGARLNNSLSISMNIRRADVDESSGESSGESRSDCLVKPV